MFGPRGNPQARNLFGIIGHPAKVAQHRPSRRRPCSRGAGNSSCVRPERAANHLQTRSVDFMWSISAIVAERPDRSAPRHGAADGPLGIKIVSRFVVFGDRVTLSGLVKRTKGSEDCVI